MKNHKISLFKNSVNFKRFTFKITKFKRKSLIRLKHRSNWLIYTNVIKLWVGDYIFNKNYLKFQFMNNIFSNNFFFYNFNFIKNRNESFFYNFNFIFCTLTNRKYYYFNNTNIKFFKNSPLTLAFFYKSPVLNSSILPVYSSFQNSLIPFDVKNLSPYFFDYSTIFDLLFSIILKKNLEIRKIISLLFFFSFKNVK